MLNLIFYNRRDKEEFLEDLEEDPELWQQVDLYKDDDASSVTSETDEEQFPGPKLGDLIAGMDKMTIEEMETDE